MRGTAPSRKNQAAPQPGSSQPDEPVNHHTLPEFRVRHEEALEAVFSQVPAALQQGPLVDLTIVAVDGANVRPAPRLSSHLSGIHHRGSGHLRLSP